MSSSLPQADHLTVTVSLLPNDINRMNMIFKCDTFCRAAAWPSD